MCRPATTHGAPYNVRTMSSIAGSSSVRSMTSVIAVTSARTRGGGRLLRAEHKALSLAVKLASDMCCGRHAEVGTRLGQVDDKHTLQRHVRSQARQPPVEDQAAAVDHQHSLAEPLDVADVRARSVNNVVPNSVRSASRK